MANPAETNAAGKGANPKVFFEISIGGDDAGRIVMEVRGVLLCFFCCVFFLLVYSFCIFSIFLVEKNSLCVFVKLTAGKPFRYNNSVVRFRLELEICAIQSPLSRTTCVPITR